jgi:hypothetical protein
VRALARGGRCGILPPSPRRLAAHVLLGYSRLYAPDAIEQALPDAAAAVRLLSERRPAVLAGLGEIARRHGGDPRALDAALLGAARLGLRHGGLGSDFHAYHNESHVLDVGHRRLLHLVEALGDAAPEPADVDLLLVFAACHDLRQRETVDVPGPVGGNEAASAAEALRILEVCGFRPDLERAPFVALELMIAGSTFDARPAESHSDQDSAGADDLPALVGGSLARSLGAWLDTGLPGWRADADARRGERLGRLAADLDTANVGETFPQLCETAIQLCGEREMRCGREIASAAAALPCLDFLGPGQDRYFHELHRFSSREGERVFGPMKRENGPKVRATTAALLAGFADRPPASGLEVVAAFAALTGAGPG